MACFHVTSLNIFIRLLFIEWVLMRMAITVVARSTTSNVYARSKAGIVSSNPTQDMDVCVCVYSVFVLSCV
jgi:hypothetical protein